MKTYMPLNGLRWSRNSGSANCDMPQSAVFGRPGGYSQIDAVLYLIAAATNNSISYEYFHFLQGSDLPIKSQNQIHDFLGNLMD